MRDNSGVTRREVGGMRLEARTVEFARWNDWLPPQTTTTHQELMTNSR